MGLRVSGSRKGVSGSRGVFFPEWCFRFPGGFGGSQGVFSSRAGVFSVPRFGFDVPGNGVLGARGCFQFPGWCFRFPARGDGMAVFVVPVRCFGFPCVFLPFFVASSCFFLLLCFPLLPSFLPPFLISSASALLPVFLLSCPPFLPSPFLPCLLLPFL